MDDPVVLILVVLAVAVVGKAAAPAFKGIIESLWNLFKIVFYIALGIIAIGAFLTMI